MALITKQVKVSNKVEAAIAKKLGVEQALFKRVKFVTPFVFRFSFFLIKKGEMVGTLNYFWDIRKPQQMIFIKRFSDNGIMRVRHMNEPRIQNFLDEE